jgi:hypothetical protein
MQQSEFIDEYMLIYMDHDNTLEMRKVLEDRLIQLAVQYMNADLYPSYSPFDGSVTLMVRSTNN